MIGSLKCGIDRRLSNIFFNGVSKQSFKITSLKITSLIKNLNEFHLNNLNTNTKFNKFNSNNNNSKILQDNFEKNIQNIIIKSGFRHKITTDEKCYYINKQSSFVIIDDNESIEIEYGFDKTTNN